MTLSLFLIAGESSGDRLGAALMAGVKQLHPDVIFHGIGGPLMQAEGLDSLFPMEELAVMGIAEVLPRLRHLFALKRQAAEAVVALAPDALITIDSPDFCLRVAKQVRETAPHIRTMHYVAPSVWAWRPKRAGKMAEVIDHVLALLPFEPPLMEKAGMACDFAGHPVVAEPQATREEVAAFRQEFGLGNAPFVLALPGSRRSEISRLAPDFGAALKRFLETHPDYKVVVPAAAPVAGLVAEALQGWPEGTVLIDPNKFDPATAKAHKRAAFAAADLALAASGTVSLELAAAATPMVIAYKFQWLTWQIMKRMALIDTVTLVNLVSDTRVVPECLGPECTPDNIAARLAAVSADPGAQLGAMDMTMQRLGKGGEEPGLRAARAVLDRLPQM